MTQNVSGIVAGVVVCVVVLVTLVATSLTPYIKKLRDQRRNQGSQDEETQVQSAEIADASAGNKKRPTALPLYKTRKSLTRSTESSPVDVVTPGIRFTITSPSHMSRKTTSVKSLASIEDVLEEHEQDLDEVDLSEDTRKVSLSVPLAAADESVSAEKSSEPVTFERVDVVEGPIEMRDNSQQYGDNGLRV